MDLYFVVRFTAFMPISHHLQAILCARSAHFRAMFTSGMRESTAKEVEMKADVMTRVRRMEWIPSV